MDDLRRWRSLDQVKNYVIMGARYWGSAHEGKFIDHGTELTKVSVADGKGNMSERTADGYIRPYQISKINNPVFDGYNFTEAHYLSPLPQSVFRETASGDQTDLNTSVVYQNPGWTKIAGEGPTTKQARSLKNNLDQIEYRTFSLSQMSRTELARVMPWRENEG